MYYDVAIPLLVFVDRVRFAVCVVEFRTTHLVCCFRCFRLFGLQYSLICQLDIAVLCVVMLPYRE